jgi:protein SCO1/2
MLLALKTCLFALMSACPVPAESAEPVTPLASPQERLLRNVQFHQLLDNQVPMDAEFVDDQGRHVTLGNCIAGRPTILVLAYYRCPMLCNQVLQGLARALQGIDFQPGKDIEVVVISFDPSDTVELAAAKKAAFIDAGGNGGGEVRRGLHFLISDQRVVTTVAKSVGFEYRYDAATKQFAHASGIVILTPAGRTSRYFYGIDYPTRDMRLALVEASSGGIGSPIDELLLFCFHYDPTTGRYGLAVIRLIRAAGIATAVCLAGFIWISLRRERRRLNDVHRDVRADLHPSPPPGGLA